MKGLELASDFDECYFEKVSVELFIPEELFFVYDLLYDKVCRLQSVWPPFDEHLKKKKKKSRRYFNLLIWSTLNSHLSKINKRKLALSFNNSRESKILVHHLNVV